MKKSKLLCSVLPISIIGGSIPALVTSCNDKETTIATMTIDESGVSKDGYVAVETATETAGSALYKGFSVNEGFDISNIKVKADWDEEDFDGLITTQLIKVDDQHFNVRVVFQAYLLPLTYQEPKFSLIFTNKLDTENTQTITDFNLTTFYGKLTVNDKHFTTSQKLVTKEKRNSFTCKGYLSAAAVINEETIEITDFSSFSVEAIPLSTETTLKLKPEIITSETGVFGIKLNIENQQNVDNLLVSLKFTNKYAPDWYQYVTIDLTITDDVSQGFEYIWNTEEQRAYIIHCYVQDETIEIPDEVNIDGVMCKILKIYTDSFANCQNLRNLKLPKYVDYVGTSTGRTAFWNTNIRNISVDPDNQTFTSRDNDDKEANCIMKKVDGGAPVEVVVGCSGTTTLPSTITTIDDYAFYGCLGLKNITIPESVTSIGKAVFKNCTALESITLPSSIESISEEMFNGCTSLKEMSLPENITTLVQYSFANSGLEKLHINKKLRIIGTGALHPCYNLKEIVVEPGGTFKSTGTVGGVENVECNCIIDNTSIKCGCINTTIPDNVQTIDSSAFNSTSIKNIEIPSNIESIAYKAFGSCPNLETVTFKGENVSFGQYVFESCPKLKTVTLPSKQVEIGEGIFNNCINLEDCVIPSTVTAIRREAFQNCSKYKLNLPASVETIAPQSFKKCTSIDKFILPEGSKLSIIDSSAFEECTSLTEVDFSKGTQLTTLGGSAFTKCSELSSVSLSDSITTIKSECLSYTKLKEITLPKSLSEMGVGVFNNCKSLETVTFTDNVLTTIPNYAFQACTALKTVNFANDCAITTFSKESFVSCSSLESFTIPATVTTIGEGCFSLSGLKSITIPLAVTTISKDAFKSCADLTSAKFENINNWIDASSTAVVLSDTDYASNAKLLVACNGWTRS